MKENNEYTVVWSDRDYKSSVINVVRSEKHNQKTGEYFIDTTKNDKHRQIPLTESMKDVLKRTKVEELKHGYTTEGFCRNENGRGHTAEVAHLSRSALVRRLHEGRGKSPHKYLDKQKK